MSRVSRLFHCHGVQDHCVDLRSITDTSGENARFLEGQVILDLREMKTQAGDLFKPGKLFRVTVEGV